MCRGAEAARLSAEDRTRSSEDRKIAQETRVRTQRSFKFVLGRSPTPLLLPLRSTQGLAGKVLPLPLLFFIFITSLFWTLHLETLL